MSSKSAVTAFLVGSAVTLTFLNLWNREKSTEKKEIRRIPRELRDEQLSRHTLYFGEEGMKKLQNSKIVVIGVGSVGSHAAHMLARSGVSRIRLIDFDTITASSLNAHACATRDDVGTAKVTCLQKMCEELCPDPNYLIVEGIMQKYTQDNAEELLDGHNWDMVIDTIGDNDVPSKVCLFAQCIRKGIRVVSAMSVEGKFDTTRLRICDLKTASRDPTASKIRQSLKGIITNKSIKYADNTEQLTIVYSSERTTNESEEEKKENNMLLPLTGIMTAVMGQTLASIALCELGNKPFTPITGDRVGRVIRKRMLRHLQIREVKIRESVELATSAKPVDEEEKLQGRILNGTWVGPVRIDSDDVEYLLDVWRNRCSVTGDRIDTDLELVRWDLSKPSVCQNLVLIGANALQEFEKDGKDSIPVPTQQIIDKRLLSV